MVHLPGFVRWKKRFELSLSVEIRQADEPLEFLAVAAKGYRNTPTARVGAEGVLECVHAVNVAAAETDDFVVVTQSAAKGITVLENLIDDNSPVAACCHGGAE